MGDGDLRGCCGEDGEGVVLGVCALCREQIMAMYTDNPRQPCKTGRVPAHSNDSECTELTVSCEGSKCIECSVHAQYKSQLVSHSYPRYTA